MIEKKTRISNFNFVLPRTDEDGRCYISYSQHSKWRTSVREYIRQYFFGEPFKGNAYTEFGKRVGEAIEKNDYSTFDKEEKKTLAKVTRLDEFERRVELDFGPFYVMGFIDTNDTLGTTLIDYKTGGRDKMTYYKADFYDQLAIYAAALEQETGFLPQEAFVELIERTGNPFKGEPLKIGEEIIRIQKNISPKRVQKACDDFLKTAKEIHHSYRIFHLISKIIV